MTQLWGGRFEDSLAPEVLAFTRSTHFDVRLAREDCAVLGAHARALAAAGLLTKDEADAARTTLGVIGPAVASGAFATLPEDEDVHTVVERALAERVPDIAGKLRAGLSRNDRVATAFRMWLRDALNSVSSHLIDAIGALADRAAEHTGTLMPGYTHLQRAQPVTLGFVLAAHASALQRDAGRIVHAAQACRHMPLGAGALAGSTLGLDASALRAELGFDDVVPNPIDAVSARDFAAEFLAAAAICGVHLSRLAEEIVLWTSSEFSFASLGDAYATGSSLMPQKKNPDVAELVRGKAGRLIGDLAGFLATMKGLPLAYNRDLQEDKEPVFDAVDTLQAALPALAGAVRSLAFDAVRMREAASDPLLLATDLAEYLVRKGVPFAQAHEAVGRAVRASIERKKDWRSFGPADWKEFSDAFGDDVTEVLNVERSVEIRLGPLKPHIEAIRDWVRLGQPPPPRA